MNSWQWGLVKTNLLYFMGFIISQLALASGSSLSHKPRSYRVEPQQPLSEKGATGAPILPSSPAAALKMPAAEAV